MTLIPFWTKDRDSCKALHITVNGHLALAERTGRFAELSDPYYCGDEASGPTCGQALNRQPTVASR